MNKAISVKQPWAYLLCAGIKPIENRTWPLPEKHKGERTFIHAGAKPVGQYFNEGVFTSLRGVICSERRFSCVFSSNKKQAN